MGRGGSGDGMRIYDDDDDMSLFGEEAGRLE